MIQGMLMPFNSIFIIFIMLFIYYIIIYYVL